MAQVTLDAVRQLLPPNCTVAFAQTSTKAEQIKLVADADVVMIAGTFIAVVEVYQRVLLHYGQIEAQRAQLNQAQDQHERGTP